MSRAYTRIDLKQQSGFSTVEKKHLLIALVVLTLAFAISFTGGITSIGGPTFVVFLLISFLSVGTAFVFHELAHRKMARNYGCWAEFRMWRWGLMMAILFSFLGFVFAAPGAVMIRGNITREQNGKISAAGPATNWAVGTIFLTGSVAAGIYGIGSLYFILAFVSYVNLFLGGFNLLPIGPLDGRKIFGWSIKNYITLAGLLGSTFIIGYLLGPFTAFL